MSHEGTIERPAEAETSALATATFAMGQFWDAEPVFGAVDGVVRTRAGFAGGVEADPTFLEPGDHAEAVQTEYDPDVISYPDLVERFWESHDPTAQPDASRYRRAIFWHNQRQRRAVQAAVDAVDEAQTRVEPFVSFDLAAPAHQKYRLRQHDDVTDALGGWRDVDVRESPLTTKLNAYLTGHGSREALADALDELGVEGVPRLRILRRVHGREET